jgi:hypothetical protein
MLFEDQAGLRLTETCLRVGIKDQHHHTQLKADFKKKKKKTSLKVVVQAFNSSTGEAEAGRHEFGANLIYIPRQPVPQKETLSRNPAPLDFSCHSPQT